MDDACDVGAGVRSVAVDTITIGLGDGCCDSALPIARFDQLNVPKYTQGVSLMPVPDSRAEWEAEHRTARKRAWRAERLGYRFAEVDLSAFNADVYRINTSLEQRQGRPMSDGYRKPISRGPLPSYDCERHRIRTFGVLRGDRLLAYLTLHRVGELALVSMILGHGAHLPDDIMYLLFAGAVDAEAGAGGWFYYNRHDSGTDGLRYYKERTGFAAADVEFVL